MLRFHPDIESDLREAIGWYSGISADLANRFRAMVNASLDAIAQKPALYPIVFDDVRFFRVRTFPYLVQYRVVNDTPYIRIRIRIRIRGHHVWRRRVDQ